VDDIDARGRQVEVAPGVGAHDRAASRSPDRRDLLVTDRRSIVGALHRERSGGTAAASFVVQLDDVCIRREQHAHRRVHSLHVTLMARVLHDDPATRHGGGRQRVDDGRQQLARVDHPCREPASFLGSQDPGQILELCATTSRIHDDRVVPRHGSDEACGLLPGERCETGVLGEGSATALMRSCQSRFEPGGDQDVDGVLVHIS
jgi:hypothetical protein